MSFFTNFFSNKKDYGYNALKKESRADFMHDIDNEKKDICRSVVPSESGLARQYYDIPSIINNNDTVSLQDGSVFYVGGVAMGICELIGYKGVFRIVTKGLVMMTPKYSVKSDEIIRYKGITIYVIVGGEPDGEKIPVIIL